MPAGLLLVALAAAPQALAAKLPPGFRETTALQGFYVPTTVRFAPAPSTAVFVAEQNGRVWGFDSLADTSPTLVADLRTQVQNYWDRGLLGLAVDPNYATNRRIYVSYTRNAPPGGTAPTWPTLDPDSTGDDCPDPPGATTDGCAVTGRLSRLTVDPVTGTAGPEQVLVTDWCQQFPSHSMGSIAFGADGALYATGGDGADFNAPDYGQHGGGAGSPTPRNPCGDPPGGVGGAMSPPTAQGGALRAQDLRTSGDPVGLNGSLIRIDPETGDAMPDNPRAASSDPNERRIVAYGMRNPFRFAIRPGTSDVWIGDVGWGTWDEIDRVPSPRTEVRNFGWPCREGPVRQPAYEALGLDVCRDLYADGSATDPVLAIDHDPAVHSAPDDGCDTTSGASVSGEAFYPGGAYPSRWDGALFFADYARNCILAMRAGPDGLPDPSRVSAFASDLGHPVDLQAGPGGDLFYPDPVTGTVRRIEYTAGNQPPVADLKATPTSGPAPLSVRFDAGGSSDPDGGDLTYQWDFDGDGTWDSSAAAPTHTYDAAGTVTAKLRVTDADGAATETTQSIVVGGSPPVARIDPAVSSARWSVGDTLAVAGSGQDAQDGPLGGASLRWDVTIAHCPAGGCHSHPLRSFTGAAGSFTAPDHEYPSRLVLRLTATDSDGLTGTDTVDLWPRTVDLTLRSVTGLDTPQAFDLGLNQDVAPAPFTRTVIVGSRTALVATTPPEGSPFAFAGWTDATERIRSVTAPAANTVYTARYRDTRRGPVARGSAHPASGLAPLSVQFDGSASSDDVGDELGFAWDLDGDGQFDDSTAVRPTRLYAEPTRTVARLRVTDLDGNTSTTEVPVTAVAPGSDVLDPSPPVGSLPPPDTTAPVLRSVHLARTRFAARRGGRGGTTVAFRLSEPASIVARVARTGPGRRVGTLCRRATPGGSGAPCTLLTYLDGRIARSAGAGPGAFGLSGRLSGRTLAPGRYRLVLVAADAAGNRSTARAVTFRILP